MRLDAGPGGTYHVDAELDDGAGSSWICLDVEESEECGRRIVTGAQGQARSATSTSGATTIGTAFDRLSESLWMDETP